MSASLRSAASRAHSLEASTWGWIALGATAVSVIGYLMQLALDHTPPVAVLDEAVFFGLFEGVGLFGLVVGCVAIATGWRRGDLTVRFGLVAIAWVVLAQTIQSLWD